MRIVRYFVTVGALIVTVTACSSLLGGGPPQQPIINNVTPSGSDSGLTILLAVAGIGAFMLLGITVCLAVYASYERRRRIDAEIAVETLTGHPIRQLRMIIRAPLSVEQLFDNTSKQLTTTPQTARLES